MPELSLWLVLIASPFIGSFIAVLALRYPDWRGVAFGRSRCDACGRTLGPLELVPVASFLTLRGRCGNCGAPIARMHLAVELGAVAVAVSAVLLTPGGGVLYISCLLGWALLALAAIDARTGFLPDLLTYPLIVLGIGLAALASPNEAADHAIGAVAGFVIFAAVTVLYRWLRGRDGLGLGDAKLLAAGGAWLGWQALPSVVLFAAMIGLVFVLARRAVGHTLYAADRIAFGPALALAIWCVWLFGPLVPS
ncbi:MAG: prepilin peptidase [Alphaproteobacteria bacterium]|nr:prepilin peptidase [Alphaproteobacteria bacterium]MBL6939898.1 prepilin peptidase [Alphaproteobacteria bacterium]MBL7099816.1 prepilin peptidase [Alphaproteobacteria bacterium]